MATSLDPPYSPKEGCLTERLDLFSLPKTDYSIEKETPDVYYPSIEVRPDSKSFVIQVEPCSSFIDLREISLEFMVKVTLGDGNDLPPMTPPAVMHEQGQKREAK